MLKNIFPREERKWVDILMKSEIQAGSNDIHRYSFIFSKSRKINCIILIHLTYISHMAHNWELSNIVFAPHVFQMHLNFFLVKIKRRACFSRAKQTIKYVCWLNCRRKNKNLFSFSVIAVRNVKIIYMCDFPILFETKIRNVLLNTTSSYFIGEAATYPVVKL